MLKPCSQAIGHRQHDCKHCSEFTFYLQALERDIKNIEKERGSRVKAAQAKLDAAKREVAVSKAALRAAEAALTAARAEAEAADAQAGELATAITLTEAGLQGTGSSSCLFIPVVEGWQTTPRLGSWPRPSRLPRPACKISRKRSSGIILGVTFVKMLCAGGRQQA